MQSTFKLKLSQHFNVTVQIYFKVIVLIYINPTITKDVWPSWYLDFTWWTVGRTLSKSFTSSCIQMLTVYRGHPRPRIDYVSDVKYYYLYPHCCCSWRLCCCSVLWVSATALTGPAGGWCSYPAPDRQHRWRGTYRPAGPLCAGLISRSKMREQREKTNTYKDTETVK